MILSDRDIKKNIEEWKIIIDPMFPKCIQPASIDLHLWADFLIFKNSRHAYIDVAEPVEEMMSEVNIDDERQFILHPGEFALGMTYEIVWVPTNMVARLEWKSSIARLGIIVHTTAGFIDPGNKLKITLELFNMSNLPVKLYYKMPIAQIAFELLSSEADICYGKDWLNSKYYGDLKPKASQYYKNFLKNNEWIKFKG